MASPSTMNQGSYSTNRSSGDGSYLPQQGGFSSSRIAPHTPYVQDASDASGTGGFSGRAPQVIVRKNSISIDPSLKGDDVTSSFADDVTKKLIAPTDLLGKLWFYLERYLYRFVTYGSDLPKDGSLPDLMSSSSMASRLMFFLLLCASLYIPTLYEHLDKPPKWGWRLDRNLNGRNCVMNLFMEKQAGDEFNPDFVEFKPKKDKNGKTIKPTKNDLIQKPPKPVNGTYRTKGQLTIIERLIESVADSFRANTTIAQHLIFTNARDGGHLAGKALESWPPRGTFLTQLHIVAADEPEDSEDAIGYEALEKIEENFKGRGEQVHVYDRVGLAGLVGDDDNAAEDWLDENLQNENNFGRDGLSSQDEEEEGADGNSTNATITSKKKYRRRKTGKLPYPDFRSFFPEDEENTQVPYFHVDGETWEDQLEILETARPLLEDQTITVVGVEHTEDLDPRDLIEFFRTVKFKSFFLASRQIHRIDHICPEMLDDVLDHPSVVKHPRLSKFAKMRRWVWEHLGFPPKKPKPKQVLPPFFVAMPRGRINRQEMTIQHNYDLFGGYGGGGGQIKTANDRKLPGKK